ncbi:hypothetical protein [Kribbella sp. NPDC048915]|uniref:COG1470 family protein n=1 Tax=Kribbella sp. NPDC048915 TaxID=3155148 RepID=UPI00340F3D55
MAATVTLSTESLAVVPGETGSCEIRITNTGRLVDQFSLRLVGVDGDWVTLESATLNLMPGSSGQASITFAPPKAADVPAGTHGFGVRVVSREDPDASVVAEGAVDVAPYREIVTELVPAKRRARRRAKFRLAVDNLGNSETEVQIGLRDPDDELVLRTRHPVILAEPGTATLVKLSAVPQRRFWRGQPKMLPFEVIATPTAEEPVKATGVVQQEQLMPKWLLPALAAAVVLAVALVAAWYALLKPAVQSVATEQTQQEVARAETAASKASTAADKATAAATVAQQAAGISPSPTPGTSDGGGKPSVEPTGSPTSRPSGGPGSGTPPATARPGPAVTPPAGPAPLSFRIASDAKPVTDGSFQPFTYTAPPKKTVRITDLVLQNPRGDNGILRIIIGQNVLLETGLANFRDLDYHYLQALTAAPGQAVVVAVNCTAPGPGFDRCTPSVSFSGQLV